MAAEFFFAAAEFGANIEVRGGIPGSLVAGRAECLSEAKLLRGGTLQDELWALPNRAGSSSYETRRRICLVLVFLYSGFI